MKEFDIKEIAQGISGILGKAAQVDQTILGETRILIHAEKLREVVQFLKGKQGWVHLSAITGQRRQEDQSLLEILYHFWQGNAITLCLSIPLEEACVASIIDLIPGADYYERELAEMFSVRFSNREDVPHLLLPDDWQEGAPMMIGRIK